MAAILAKRLRFCTLRIFAPSAPLLLPLTILLEFEILLMRLIRDI